MRLCLGGFRVGCLVKNMSISILSSQHLVVNTHMQTLALYGSKSCSAPIFTAPISTAKNGTGSQLGSFCTPLGRHKICKKIGAGLPKNSVFVARRYTGEQYSPKLAAKFPSRDWILTRILRLEGLEEGKNRGTDSTGNCCDSFERFIYIHGTPDTEPMGVPHSHGCIRLHGAAMMALFDLVELGAVVEIV